MKPFQLTLMGTVLMGFTVLGVATSGANQFDDLIFPPSNASAAPNAPTNNQASNPYLPMAPYPYTYGMPYTASSYPYPYNAYSYGQPLMQPLHQRQQQSTNNTVPKPKQKPWGDTRYIWPDFYTDATGELWDNMFNAPHSLGYMPGGWRFPSFSSPDPVTVGDAITNQFPPIMEEIPNFMDFTQ